MCALMRNGQHECRFHRTKVEICRTAILSKPWWPWIPTRLCSGLKYHDQRAEALKAWAHSPYILRIGEHAPCLHSGVPHTVMVTADGILLQIRLVLGCDKPSHITVRPVLFLPEEEGEYIFTVSIPELRYTGQWCFDTDGWKARIDTPPMPNNGPVFSMWNYTVRTKLSLDTAPPLAISAPDRSEQ